MYKMRVDIINPTLRIIIDLKTVGWMLDRNYWEDVIDDSGRLRKNRINFIQEQKYLLQGCIYKTGAAAKYGFEFDYFLGACEKNEFPRFELIELDSESTEPYKHVMNAKAGLFMAMLDKRMKPFKCGSYKCAHCAPLRKVTKPINWREL